MANIESTNFRSPHLEQLYKWFVAEWKEVDPFVECKNGVVLPAPILALENGALIGGLSFTGYAKPKASEAVLWVNAIFVLPAHRGAGVATQLLREAEQNAMQVNANELYALSDIPALYEKLNWEIFCQTNRGAILKRNLSATQ